MNVSFLRHRRARVHTEPIEMRERRYGYSPKVFRSRGHSYSVHVVERCWTLPRRRRRSGEQRCFLVRCAEGEFVVCQDLAAKTWHLSGAESHEESKARSS